MSAYAGFALALDGMLSSVDTKLGLDELNAIVAHG